jgi:hypothetical protein
MHLRVEIKTQILLEVLMQKIVQEIFVKEVKILSRPTNK